MKKSYEKILLLEIFMISAIIIDVLLLKNLQVTSTVNIIIWSITNIILFILIGFEKDKNLYKIDTLQIVFVFSFIYLIFRYFIGVFVGFNSTPYSLTFFNIIKNISPLIILIILQELFRYNLITKAKDNKLLISLILFIFIIFNIVININYYDFNTAMDIFEVIGILILPSIANNCLLTFITKKSGMYPSILYRIIDECLIFVVPIVPDLNIYIDSVLKIIFPTLLFLKFNTMYAKNKFTKIIRRSLFRKAINISISSVVIIIVILVSGGFKYYAMAIGSGSMDPYIKKGDAVVLSKNYDEIDLEKGVVIAYYHGNTVIVHRIYDMKLKNNKYIITTKGDNNKDKDSWEVSTKDIIGIVKFKVPYVGWPSVWLSEII